MPAPRYALIYNSVLLGFWLGLDRFANSVGVKSQVPSKTPYLSVRAIGSNRAYFSGLGYGVRNPSVAVVARLAAVLGTTPAALLTKAAEFGLKWWWLFFEAGTWWAFEEDWCA